MEPLLIKVKIISPQSSLYSGSAKSLTGYNSQGKFDILPQHAHFISEIKKEILIRADNDETKKIEFKNGILRCWDNEIQAYIVQS